MDKNQGCSVGRPTGDQSSPIGFEGGRLRLPLENFSDRILTDFCQSRVKLPVELVFGRSVGYRSEIGVLRLAPRVEGSNRYRKFFLTKLRLILVGVGRNRQSRRSCSPLIRMRDPPTPELVGAINPLHTPLSISHTPFSHTSCIHILLIFLYNINIFSCLPYMHKPFKLRLLHQRSKGS